MTKSTLLTEDQIWGDNSLDVLKKYGTRVACTDLAVLLGAWLSSGTKTSDNLRTGLSWSASASSPISVRVVDGYGDRYDNEPRNR